MDLTESIAQVVYDLKQNDYMSLSPTKSKWLKFDGLKWAQSEVGIWEVLSTDVVEHYSSNSAIDPETLGAIVFKLKHSSYKMAICRLCYTLFYDPCRQLNKSENLVCFKNGILNLRSGSFLRAGRRNWYITLWIDEDYDAADAQRMELLIYGHAAARQKALAKQVKLRKATECPVQQGADDG